MSDDEGLRCARSPCATCPYRRDVPSGIWDKSEYQKLPLYDGPTWAQHPNIFMCHQRDGRMCAGWVGCHGAQELLALRMATVTGDIIHPSTWGYKSPVPLWSTGLAAMEHGMREIDHPGFEARRQVEKLDELRKKRRRKRR